MVGLKSSHGHLLLPVLKVSGQCREGTPLPLITNNREKNDGFLNCIQGKVTGLECLAGHQEQWKFHLSKKRNKTEEGRGGDPAGAEMLL